MTTQRKTVKPLTFTLEPCDNKRLVNLCGEQDKNLRQIENSFNVEISNRGFEFHIIGPKTISRQVQQTIVRLFNETAEQRQLSKHDVNLVIKAILADPALKSSHSIISVTTPKLTIVPRTPNQTSYLENIIKYDINFGVGPAGTGKTFLAVAYAVHALENLQINRIIITRPIVEAGERLGYLPGDIAQKVDPYLRPIYDALYDMLGFAKVAKLISSNIIEIAPLAFMRGRTLNDAVIILDEAQNTTVEQMKMFLTRLGFGSKAIITGDITQTDLPKNQSLGLKNALEILQNENEIGFAFFQSVDIVRHGLVKRIVRAYEQNEKADS